MLSGIINFYDNIIIGVNNSNIIESIGGRIFFPNNRIVDWNNQVERITNLFKDYKWSTYKKHNGDPTRKNKGWRRYYH